MAQVGRFLIVSWDSGGNVQPALDLGARLLHAWGAVSGSSVGNRWSHMRPSLGLEFTSIPPQCHLGHQGLLFERAFGKSTWCPALLGRDTQR